MPRKSTASLYDMRPLLTPEQVAEQFSTTVDVIYTLASKRRIPFIRLPGAIRFMPADIEAAVEYRDELVKQSWCQDCGTKLPLRSPALTGLCRSCLSAPGTVRFWRYVDKDGPIPEHMPHLGPCWLWTGATNGRYGMFSPEGGAASTIGAHRCSYQYNVGPIPEGQHVLHHCDNPPCVRPDHLFLGDNQANTDDKIRKGRDRAVIGDGHHWTRLSDNGVRTARQLHEEHGMTATEIAKRLGVSRPTISRILNGKHRVRVQ